MKKQIHSLEVYRTLKLLGINCEINEQATDFDYPNSVLNILTDPQVLSTFYEHEAYIYLDPVFIAIHYELENFALRIYLVPPFRSHGLCLRFTLLTKNICEKLLYISPIITLILAAKNMLEKSLLAIPKRELSCQKDIEQTATLAVGYLLGLNISTVDIEKNMPIQRLIEKQSVSLNQLLNDETILTIAYKILERSTAMQKLKEIIQTYLTLVNKSAPHPNFLVDSLHDTAAKTVANDKLEFIWFLWSYPRKLRHVYVSYLHNKKIVIEEEKSNSLNDRSVLYILNLSKDLADTELEEAVDILL